VFHVVFLIHLDYTSLIKDSHSISFYLCVTQHMHELNELRYWFYVGAYLPNKAHILNANIEIFQGHVS